MKFFLVAHFSIFIIFYFYIFFAIKIDRRRKDLKNKKINKLILLLITFFWEIIVLIAIIFYPLKTVIKIRLYFKNKAAN
jgi:heme/copper-type cytochrome/quinol oxidase subunit 2